MIFCKKRFYTLFLIFTIVGAALNAQNRKFTFAGIGVGLQTDRIAVLQDSGSQLQSRWTSHSLLSFLLRQEISRRFSISTGCRLSQLKLGFRFRSDDSGYKIPAMTSVQIPLQLQLIQPITYGIPEFQLGISAGVVCDLPVSIPSEGTLNGFIGSDIQNSNFKAQYQYLKNVRWLGELGVLANVMYGKGTTLWLGIFSTFGFQSRGNVQIDYKTKEMLSSASGTLENKGLSLSVQVGFHYPISRWWQPSFYKSNEEKPKRGKKFYN